MKISELDCLKQPEIVETNVPKKNEYLKNESTSC